MDKEDRKCSWCGDPILENQPTSRICDGDILHFGCACEADDPDYN